MTEQEKAEIRALVRKEFSEILKEKKLYDISDERIELRTNGFLKEESQPNGYALEMIGKINNGIVFVLKKGVKYVKIIVIVLGFYSTASDFFGELFIPNSLLSVKQIAQIFKKGVISGYKNLRPDESKMIEKFAVIDKSWEKLHPVEYEKTRVGISELTINDFMDRIKDHRDIIFVSSSGISEQLLQASTSISPSPSSSPSASSEIPDDIEEV